MQYVDAQFVLGAIAGGGRFTVDIIHSKKSETINTSPNCTVINDHGAGQWIEDRSDLPMTLTGDRRWKIAGLSNSKELVDFIEEYKRDMWELSEMSDQYELWKRYVEFHDSIDGHPSLGERKEMIRMAKNIHGRYDDETIERYLGLVEEYYG